MCTHSFDNESKRWTWVCREQTGDMWIQLFRFLRRDIFDTLRTCPLKMPLNTHLKIWYKYVEGINKISRKISMYA